MPNVTAFGLDYSARELSPAEIDAYNAANPGQPISFLIRYIGYSTNPKCISHYPGALAAHEANGTLVLLVHQIGYTDFHGGYEAGRAHALTSLADARRQGYPDDRPIFFAFDRYLGGNAQAGPISIGKVWEYLAGAQSVLGGERVGLYGFYDVIHPAIREGRVRWTWLCGAESGVIDGVDFYQWNNGRVRPGGLECDLNKAYIELAAFGGEENDMTPDQARKLDEIHAATRPVTIEIGPPQQAGEHGAPVAPKYSISLNEAAANVAAMVFYGSNYGFGPSITSQLAELRGQDPGDIKDAVRQFTETANNLFESMLSRLEQALDEDNADQAKATVIELRKQLALPTIPGSSVA